jgi:hypothetical protein
VGTALEHALTNNVISSCEATTTLTSALRKIYDISSVSSWVPHRRNGCCIEIVVNRYNYDALRKAGYVRDEPGASNK